MRKKFGKICITIYSFIVTCINRVYAISYDDLYGGSNGEQKVLDVASFIAGWIRYGALVFAVGMLMIKGIKFVTASPEGKADIKKEMIPWAIGVVLLFTINAILNVVAGWGKNFTSPFIGPTQVNGPTQVTPVV